MISTTLPALKTTTRTPEHTHRISKSTSRTNVVSITKFENNKGSVTTALPWNPSQSSRSGGNWFLRTLIVGTITSMAIIASGSKPASALNIQNPDWSVTLTTEVEKGVLNY